MELMIKAKEVGLEYTRRDILDIDEIELYDYDRNGLMAANGTGKSTLQKVLLGELTLLGCKISRFGQFPYIPQLDKAVSQEVKDFALMGELNVEQLKAETMNGGEETRLKIAEALSEHVHCVLAE